MNSAILIGALLLTTTPGTPEAPSNEDLKALLKRLEPSAAPARAEAPKPEALNASAMGAPQLAPDQPATQATVMLVFGLLCAVGFATLASRKQKLATRPLRRLAAESIGARQQIVLVEALGEYLLVGTGGKEPVLLAQLDTNQAKARLDAMSARDEEREGKSLAGMIGKLRKPAPAFAEALEKAEARPAPEPSTADLAKAQAALRYLKTAEPPRAKTPITRSTRLADLGRPGEDRADEIRRRLADL